MKENRHPLFDKEYLEKRIKEIENKNKHVSEWSLQDSILHDRFMDILKEYYEQEVNP
ncbi:MAG: hypothetical protein GYA14_15825 [Ignavibacteria bacterium]|nr:hypothetical protein [Ignavibacteria bacterium]